MSKTSQYVCPYCGIKCCYTDKQDEWFCDFCGNLWHYPEDMLPKKKLHPIFDQILSSFMNHEQPNKVNR